VTFLIIISDFLQVVVGMDLSVFDAGASKDVNRLLAEIGIEALRVQRDPKVVLITAFFGGEFGEQSTPVTDAFTIVSENFKSRGVTLVLHEFTNSIVKYKYHWTCRELFNALIAADIHLLPTHLHQGMLALGGTDSYNITNILDNIERLRYHLGVPCGANTGNPVGTQHKMILYNLLAEDNLCAPTISVDISVKEILQDDVDKIKR